MALWEVNLFHWVTIQETATVEVEAKTKEEAIDKAWNAEAHHWEDCDSWGGGRSEEVTCLIEGPTEEGYDNEEVMAEIAEQNKALDRSGGDYWNFTAVEDEMGKPA